MFISAFHQVVYLFAFLLVLCDWYDLVEPVTLGDVRLVDGASELEGRLEIYVDITNELGNQELQWWTVCDDLWEISDADVVCRQLGYGPALDAPGNAYFGSGEQGIYLDNVDCDGTEQSLLECYASVEDHDCEHYEDAGVVCGESQVDGTLRLSDGTDQFQGHLEIYLQDVYQRWGAICSDGWGWNETNTACTILGFDSGSMYTTYSVHSSVIDIEVASVECDGNETSLLECSHEVDSGSCTIPNSGVYITCKPNHGTLRLTDGDSNYEGRVEVFDTATELWGTICDNTAGINWSVEEMDVVCQQLGFSQSATTDHITYSRTGTGNTVLGGLDCHGSEDSLLDCSYINWNDVTCTQVEDVGVKCEPEPITTPVRLVNGDSFNQGRIEIYNQVYRRWEAACSTSWDINDSNVLCSQLGYSFALQLIAGGYFGEDTGATYHAADYYCAGDELALEDCIVGHTPTGCAVWDHSLQAGVICSDGDDGTISSYIRLVDGVFVGQGRLEVYYNGEWGSVCDDYWTTTNSDVVCQHLGFDSAVDYYTNVIDVGVPVGTGRIWLDDVSCSGMESSLFSCSHPGWGYHNCVHSEDVAVVCTGSTATETQIQLVDGSTPSSGRVEIYYNDIWTTICGTGWDFNDADVACKMAGYHGAESHTGPGSFGQGTGIIFFGEMECTGTEDSLLDCPHSGWYARACMHDYDAGVICLDDDIRLVDGTSQYNGRVEVFHNGQWAALCSHGFDTRAGNVVCRQLGYGSFSSLASFEGGTQSIVLSDVDCSGTEDKLLDCSINDSGDTNCQPGEEAGVICNVLENGAIRLVEGSSMYEGRVEVYFGDNWGTICDDNWHLVDGDVVCRQLGYGHATVVYSNAYYGLGTGPILLDDVWCTGSESSISDCIHNGWGDHNCVHGEDASVRCYGASADGGMGMGAVCGIIAASTTFVFILCVVSKHLKSNPSEHSNCGEKFISICGCSEDTTSTRTGSLGSTWGNHNRGCFNDDERTFSGRDATIFYNHGPYPAVNIAGLGPNSNLNQLRTHDGLPVLPPSYEELTANNTSIHGFPDTTHNPSSEVPSRLQPQYCFTNDDHEELPTSPPPPYESVVNEGNTRAAGQNNVFSDANSDSSTTQTSLRTIISSPHVREQSIQRSLTPVGN